MNENVNDVANWTASDSATLICLEIWNYSLNATCCVNFVIVVCFLNDFYYANEIDLFDCGFWNGSVNESVGGLGNPKGKRYSIAYPILLKYLAPAS